ncbi:MAG: hypothetical protein JRI97_06920 [Deltaproteobacteria bacterium]|nr:hypothetical protein [Deltaproteobacteria bacterium]
MDISAPNRELRYLTGRKLAVFLAAADRIIPAFDSLPSGGTMTTAQVVDWALERMEPGLRKRFLALLTVMEIMGVAFGARPFSKNSAKARDRQLAWMESGPSLMRMGFFGLKNYACLGYYTREAVWKAIGYAGPARPDRQYPDTVIRALCRAEAEVAP